MNARDAERIEKALGEVNLDEVVFLTLTFDPSRWNSAGAAWRGLQDCWSRFLDNLAYELGAGGRGAREKIRYVATWEQTARGWPHVHALMLSPRIAAAMREHGTYVHKSASTGKERVIWRFARNVLGKIAVAAGFGYVVDAEFVRRERGQVAGYLVKIASELTRSSSKDQRPLDAPRGFRRLRATHRFLEPARMSTGEYTGALLAARLERVEEELERGAGSFQLAAELAKNEVPEWQRPWSVPSARRCSIHEASISTA